MARRLYHSGTVVTLLISGLAFGNPTTQPEPAAGVLSTTTLRDFGARGDGRADDTAAIQKAIESGKGVVQFPKGVYRITRPIVIDLNKVGYTALTGNGVAQIVMAGPGPAFRIIGTHFKSAAPSGFAPEIWDRQRMPLVDGIAILGAHDKAVGIEASGTMQLTISRVLIRKALHGIHLVKNNRNITISDCHIYDNRGAGIYFDDANLHQSNITGCHISYNDGGGIVTRAGNVRNIHITGCDLESNMSPGAKPSANVLIDSRGGSHGTAEVAITGCTLQHNSTSPDSANIRIIGRSTPGDGQEQVREGHVTISGNVLSDVQVNIHLSHCRGVAITGNTFWMGYRHDLLAEDSSNIVVGPNNFDRNPRYTYGVGAKANHGVVFRNCEDCTLTGLHINGVQKAPAGLLIANCRRMNITGCTILNCDSAGLLLDNVAHSHVSGCIIRDDRPNSTSASLKITGGEGNMIVNNMLGTPPVVSGQVGVVRDNVHP
ncbi:MAG TPA: right-handed parallel beta-helix repeat-containing protein [Phycisphaerae bacterium]|nr:right-handed parallel beta-helix repeat-containing protein [Phycisphaerae bacterium]